MACIHCRGGKEDSLRKTVTELLTNVVTLRENAKAAIRRYELRSMSVGDLKAARDAIEYERAKIEEQLNLIKRTLEGDCIELRVALGGTRHE